MARPYFNFIFQVKFDKIGSLRTVFAKDGTITAANSSKISDGAAACVLMDSETAAHLGMSPFPLPNLVCPHFPDQIPNQSPINQSSNFPVVKVGPKIYFRFSTGHGFSQ